MGRFVPGRLGFFCSFVGRSMSESLEKRLTHQCFPQPTDRTSQVWRYLPLSKFISLLHSSQLHLSRVDLLNDPHEGSLPGPLVLARNNHFDEMGRSEMGNLFARLNQKVRQACYVSCWALSPFESEALWRLYATNADGIAIQTTYQALIDVIEPDNEIFMGKVTYLDYDAEGFPINYLYYPVMHKRRAFAHENEVRLVKVLNDHIDHDGPPGPANITVPVNLDNLVHAIYVTPYARPWYVDTVAAVVEKFAPSLAQRIAWSRMKNAPSY